MSGIINFLKNVFGMGNPDEGFIGLSSFNGGSKDVYDTPQPKKAAKKELSLSEILKRS